MADDVLLGQRLFDQQQPELVEPVEVLEAQPSGESAGDAADEGPA